MKKIISAIICMALASVGAITASASVIDNDSSVGINYEDFMHNCRIVGNDSIPHKTARLYTYGQIGASGYSVGISFTDSKTGKTTDCVFNNKVNHQDFRLPGSSYTSETKHIFSNGSSSGGPDFFLSKSGGQYKRLRVKLSDYSAYFNSDGTHTEDGHKYNFTYQNGGYLSSLIISSGGAVTAVTPDHYGFVEFYCSNRIGVPIFMSTDFSHNTSNSFSGGGGLSYVRLPFMVGDADSNGYLDIYDGTYLQMYLSESVALNDAAKISADANLDGKIDIDDATYIQKYLSDNL